MKKHLLLLLAIVPALAWSQRTPQTEKTPVTITKHGISFVDEYQWLENIGSPEVDAWTETQNAYYRQAIELSKTAYSPLKTIEDYVSKASYSLPKKKGRYSYGVYGTKNGLALLQWKDPNLPPIEIVRLKTIYPSNTAIINGFYPSRDSKIMAYTVSADGSDRNEIRFADLEKKATYDDVLTDVKFSTVAWNRDMGVFYRRNMNKDRFARDSTSQVFYHRVGTPQTDDQLVYDGTDSVGSISIRTSAEKIFVVENNLEGTMQNYYWGDINSGLGGTFHFEKLMDSQARAFKFYGYSGGRIYFSSDKYNWGDVRSMNQADKSDERVIVPQIYMNLLTEVHLLRNYIVCFYKALNKNYMNVYDYSGKLVRQSVAPTGMDMDYQYFDPETKEIYYGLYSTVRPYLNYRLSVSTGDDNEYFNQTARAKPTIFPLDYFETKTITYKNRDGLDVPIMIVHKKGLVLDGNNPTLLSGYGGFGVVSGQTYSAGLLYFLGQGGVYAYASVRGGGDKGPQWHDDGKGAKKINTVNDFIDAAEFLIREKYTSPQKLAIKGKSHGGMLVGAAMTQRPDLFKLVVAEMGIYDLSRYDQNTVGKFFHDEFGNPEVAADYKSILSYSPLQHIKDDVNYPTTLIITSDNDDRVPPFHSYKFAATLQNRAAQHNPIYLKSQSETGHSGARDRKTYVEDVSDLYGFILYQLTK